MPASSPSGGRLTSSVLPASSTSTATAYSTRRTALPRTPRPRPRAGRSPTVPAIRARHHPATGHSAQRGDRGAHTVAPSSIIASLKSPGRFGSTSRAASRRSLPAAGRSRSSSRASTRFTFPSTAGTARPNAMLATAPAVYSPTPGSVLNSSGSAGRRPPYRSRTASAVRCRFRARA
ncbi:MAG: hypothetical protein OXI71_03685 [Gemmatimonadota bacterium]|nr:hypothetical protein [Gemmatimonadota bacterium]